MRLSTLLLVTVVTGAVIIASSQVLSAVVPHSPHEKYKEECRKEYERDAYGISRYKGQKCRKLEKLEE